MFLGGIILFAAVIAWATSLMMSPHGPSIAEGTEHVRSVVVTFIRKSAIGTLVLCALSAWLLFPKPRPRNPRRDYALLGIIGVLSAASLWQLYWVSTLG